jgi:hypothetical protein
VRALAALLLTLALAPAASAQDETHPPCPAGVAPSATLRAADLHDRGGSLTATHEIGLELQVASEAYPVDEFTVSAPPGVKIGWRGTPTVRVDAPGPVPVTATWSDYFPEFDISCSISAQTTLDIEPPRPPRYIAPDRKASLMSQLEWFLRLGKDADLRPVEVQVRGVRRARVPSSAVPAKKLVFVFREGDKGVSYSNGRERAVRSAGWKFSAGFIRDQPRVLMHGLQGVDRFGVELDFLQGGKRIGRTRLVGRCRSFVCSYRTVR